MTTPLRLHLSLSPHLCCPAAPWLFHTIPPTAGGARCSLFSCPRLYGLSGSPRHNLLMLLGLLMQKWHGRSRDEPPCFSRVSRAVPGWWPLSAPASVACCLLLCPRRRSCLPPSAARAGPACQSITGKEGPPVPSPASHGAGSVSHYPALSAAAGCRSSPICRLLGKDTGSGKASQARLRTPMSAGAEEVWRLPQG